MGGPLMDHIFFLQMRLAHKPPVSASRMTPALLARARLGFYPVQPAGDRPDFAWGRHPDRHRRQAARGDADRKGDRVTP
jgi:hypothetical protein